MRPVISDCKPGERRPAFVRYLHRHREGFSDSGSAGKLYLRPATPALRQLPRSFSEIMMPTLLRIDSSSRRDGSHSRALADAFEAAWSRRFPGAKVVRRDLAAHPIAHIHEATIAGFYTPAEKLDDQLKRAVALSDELIDEINAVDTILIATPMYNFTVPSALKSWIDQIVRINRTFSFDGKSFTGLVKARRVVVVAAFGAGGYGDALAGADFVTPYLKFLFGFLGVPDVTVIPAEATTADTATVAANVDRAKDGILKLVEAA
jgi:FMN-dependent NADH-azoreductase